MTRAFSRFLAVLWMLGVAPACSDAAPDGVARGGSGSGAASGGAAGGGVAMGGGGAASAGETTALGGAAAGGLGVLEAPDQEAALSTFLAAQQYAGWAKEAMYHPSAGPHGDGVRVYYSPKAAAALTHGATTFPAGAACVKELTSGGSLYGHAVWVKVQDATDAGNGFFWYEIIHHGGGDDTVYGNARGSSDCVGCHLAGKDFDLSTLPFE